MLADDDLAPSRLRMRRKLFDTLLLGSPEDERLGEHSSVEEFFVVDFDGDS